MQSRVLAVLAALAMILSACGAAASPSPSSPASSASSSATASSSASTSATAAPSPVSIELDLDFNVSAVVAPIYYGIEQGIYRDQGIDLTVVPTSGSGGALLQINSKKVDFALIDMSSIMLDKIHNKTNLIGVATWQDYPTFAIVGLQPINDLHELEGKSFGTVAQSSGRINFPQVLQANGVDPKKVQLKLLDFSVLYQTLFTGGIDTAETGLPGSGDNLRVQAEQLGKTVYMYPFSKWGFVDYSKVVTTRQDVIDNNPDLVKRFVAATMESMKEGLANITADQAAELMTKQDPQSDPAQSKATWDDFKDLTKTYGQFDADKVSTILKRVTTQNDLTTDLQPDDFFTDDFLPSGS